MYPWLKAFGIEQGDNGMYHISFVSQHNNIVYLGDGCLVIKAKDRVESDDFNFVFDELVSLMKNEEFIKDLESYLVF